MPERYGPTQDEFFNAFLEGAYNVRPPTDELHNRWLKDALQLNTILLFVAEQVVNRDELGIFIDFYGIALSNQLDQDTAAVLKRIDADTAKIIAAIPPPFVFPKEVITDFNDIADAQAFQAFLLNEGPPAELIASVDAVEQAIRDATPAAGKTVADLLSELLPDPEAVAEGVAVAESGQATVLLRALPLLYKALQYAGPYLAIEGAAASMDLIKDRFPGVAGRIEGLGATIGTGVLSGIELLHGPMKAVLEGLSGAALERVVGQLETLDQSTPDNVLTAASKILAEAGAFGVSAHLAAVVAEKSYPSKQLGLSQMAAFLADLASFGSIARETFGQFIGAALHSPARRRANFHFRPELPDPFTFNTLFRQRLVGPEAFAAYYQQQGWADDAVDAWSRGVFRTASARELALVFEDGTVDPARALQMLQRAGFNDDDASLLLGGVQTRAIKTARQEVVTAIVASYVEGLQDDEQLAAALGGLNLSDETQQLVAAAAQQRRFHAEASKLRTVYETAAADGAITVEDLRATLAAIGYDDRAVGQAAARVNAKAGTRAFLEAATDTKAALRRAQTADIQAIKAEVRRGELPPEQVAGALVALGVAPSEADAIALLAVQSLVPVLQLPTSISAGRAIQTAVKVETDAVLALQRNGAIAQGDAYGRLVALGVDPGVASAQTQLVGARLTFPAPGGGVEIRTPQVRSAEAAQKAAASAAARQDAQQVRATAAAEARAAEASFTAGELSAQELNAALVALGQSPAAASAVVQRLQADAVASAAGKAATAARRDATATTKANQDAAVLSFRAGNITSGQLDATLRALGLPDAEAAAIVRREEARARPTARRTAAGAATSAPGA
jgi:hypothetical protein